MINKLAFWICVVGLILTSCSAEPEEPQEEKQQLNLSTRATDNVIAVGESIGLYMAYGNLASAGNYVDNLKLTKLSNDTWLTDYALYWKNNSLNANMIGYAPYDANINDALHYPFSVCVNQSDVVAINASDFLWGMLPNHAPTSEEINLTLNHLFARVIVKLTPGNGLTEEDLLNGTISVQINGTYTNALINLGDGSITTTGTSGSITLYHEGDLTYSAIVVPQHVARTGIITVVWNGVTYTLTREMTFDSDKQYTITIALNKTPGGFNISIGGWDDSGEDFGGVVN